MMLGRELREANWESCSQSSSGCQSGWTIYLDHSSHHHCSLPYYNPFQRQQVVVESEDEDSMASDASSGQPPHLCREEKALKHQYSTSYNYYSSSHNASVSDSRCFGSSSTRCHSLDKGGGKDAAVVVVEADTDDTASSSAVFSCSMINDSAPVLGNMGIVPGECVVELSSCASSPKHFKERSP